MCAFGNTYRGAFLLKTLTYAIASLASQKQNCLNKIMVVAFKLPYLVGMVRCGTQTPHQPFPLSAPHITINTNCAHVLLHTYGVLFTLPIFADRRRRETLASLSIYVWSPVLVVQSECGVVRNGFMHTDRAWRDK